jgi:hypothetical protein
MHGSSVQQWSRRLMIGCMGVAEPSSAVFFQSGSDVASSAQADSNIQRASNGVCVIRAGPFHSEYYCCMEGQYYHYVQL